MAELVAEFFGVIGMEATPPATLAELIPYLIEITIGIFLVSSCFGVFGKIAEIFMNFRRW